MNERIQEIWNEAAEAANSDDNWDCQVAFVEKFAELIVRDCVNVVINSYMGKNNPKPAVEAVERRFGVIFKRSESNDETV